MATQVQWRGGSTAEHATFTGAAREVTVDTQKKTLVVHDGSTAGGEPLLREDQANLPTSVTNGISVPSANNVAISTGGTGKLFVDASGRVGVGTNAPLLTIHAKAATAGLRLEESSASSKHLDISIDNSAVARISAPQPASSIAFETTGAERARIDSSGRFLVGTSSARGNFYGTTGQGWRFQIEGVGYLNAGQVIISNSNDALGSYLNFAKTRGSSVGSNTVVQSGDALGVIDFHGADGTDFAHGARIAAEVDGTPGANDVPGRLVFSTIAAGASSPTERMRIKSTGIVNVANTPIYADNAAAKTGGLVDGDIYRKSDGTLMIVYT